jgi:small GTP-binding protein
MALFNYAIKEITLKVVYYGPGLSGKTTNLQYLHSSLDPSRRGKLLSLSTEADRTLFFDFMPVELGKVRDFSIRFQLYTVPGQVRYNATRKLVLKGADAVVFVADSQEQMIDENLESLQNMRENLIVNNLDPENIPLVLQFNKRDLPNVKTPADLNNRLNEREVPYFESVAVDGKGVHETFETITRLLLKDIAARHKIDIKPQEEKKPEEIPIREEPVKPKKMPVPERKMSLGRKVPEMRTVSKNYTALMQKMEGQMQKMSSSLDNSKDLGERLDQYGDSIDGLTKAFSDTMRKQNEIIKLLKDIKNTMENAKKRRRWLFFR